jgi:hypothetical protein
MSVTTFWAQPEPSLRLTFFALPQDADGIADIDEIKLFNDAAGLYWDLTSKNWVSVRSGENTWLGAYNLVMPDNAAPPSGLWRAVIIDKSGEQSESTFGFDFDPLKHKFPIFTVDIHSGTYSVKTDYPQLHLLCYNSQGVSVADVALKSPHGKISDLRLNPTIAGAALWANDPEFFTSAITEVQPVK